jgi:hypothetical protein
MRLGGHVVVTGDVEPDVSSLDSEIDLADAACRMEMPWTSPTLVMLAAQWAATRVYRACQALVFREIDSSTVLAQLSAPCPVAPSPEVCYSVDLALCVLPDLLKLARAISHDDPLVKGLLELARAWPLSSVGIGDLGALDIGAFIDDRSLRSLYADRIIQRQDLGRLTDSAAADAVREALGSHPQLAPEIARALSSPLMAAVETAGDSNV